MNLKTYSFRWTNGGYNTVRALSRDEAIELAIAMGFPSEHRTVTLIPIASSFNVEPLGYVDSSNPLYILID
jgi:hypothetical protein